MTIITHFERVQGCVYVQPVETTELRLYSLQSLLSPNIVLASVAAESAACATKDSRRAGWLESTSTGQLDSLTK